MSKIIGVTVGTPFNPNNSSNAGGVSATTADLLIEILQSAVYNDDVSDKIASLKEALVPGVILSNISTIYSGGDVQVGTAVTDLTGIVVIATYSDGSTAIVTDYTLSGTIAEGSNTVTVSHGGKTTTFTVIGVVEEVEPDTPTEEPDEVIINKINAEISAIDVSTGNVVENSSRITTDFIEVNGGQDCTVVSNNGYYIRLFAYTSDKVLDSNITYRGMFNANSSTETLPETTKYIRILMKKSTEADFDETELNTISVLVNDVLYYNGNYSIETANLSYEIGAINNGVEENSSVRARTDFIKLEDETVNFNLPNNYFILRVYDADKNYIRDITSNSIKPWYFENGNCTVEDGYYVRLVICPDIYTNPEITQGALDNTALTTTYVNIGKQTIYKLQGGNV